MSKDDSRPRFRPIIAGFLALALIIGALSLALILKGVSPASPTPTPISPEPSEAVPTLEDLEKTEGTEVSNESKLGELEIKYPIRMSPASGDVVALEIYVPVELASLEPMHFEWVEIPAEAPRVVGEQGTHRATILIQETMRVELSSLTIEIKPLYPSTQEVDLYPRGRKTVWAWNIKAPETLGPHSLTARSYLGKDTKPSWVGALDIEVVELTAVPSSTSAPPHTPTPAPTPLPATQPLAIYLVGGLAILLLALLALVGVVAGVYAVTQRRKAKAKMDWVTDEGHTYNIAAIRRLLLAAFTAEELRRFCEDRPSFRPVTSRFSPSHGLDDMVDEVVIYCRTHFLWAELLDEIAAANPRQYARFEPDLYAAKPEQSDGVVHK